MITSRILFGCSRLVGGASARDAERLVQTCVRHGVRGFDLAPNYGMGTAQALIGAIFAGETQGIELQTKVGLAPPRFGRLKSVARVALRTLRGSGGVPDDWAPPTIPADPEHGNFDPDFMRRSLENSLRALRVSRVSSLLLHEAREADLSTDAAAFLEDAGRSGIAASVGLSSGYPLDQAYPPGNALPSSFRLQGAVPVAALFGAWAPPSQPIALHTLVKLAMWAGRRTPALAGSMEAELRGLGIATGDAGTALTLAAIVRLAMRYPEAKLIFSTSSASRLERVLVGLRDLEAVGQLAAVADRFDRLGAVPEAG